MKNENEVKDRSLKDPNGYRKIYIFAVITIIAFTILTAKSFY